MRVDHDIEPEVDLWQLVVVVEPVEDVAAAVVVLGPVDEGGVEGAQDGVDLGAVAAHGAIEVAASEGLGIKAITRRITTQIIKIIN